jgi:hypothetical protein
MKYSVPSANSIMLSRADTGRIPQSPGVYWWVATDEAHSYCRAVPRAIGVDPVGLLYIGISSNLRDRIGRYARAVARCSGRMEGPTCGDLDAQPANWCYLAYGAVRVYPHVAIVWQEFQDKSLAEEAETNLIYAYRSLYAEMPPFNKGMNERWLPEIKEWCESGNSSQKYYSRNRSMPAQFRRVYPNYAPWAADVAIVPLVS